ncbi:cytosolic sulfotransferase 5-like [Spinacia oleracea]|uniref:Sulfotransferase n=1 Tax=Spinacia oleracea TaxID=3562 RepID=A0A9R0K1U7_SPIOL|nr:cytosolic sulfotransferase 5-like [Spinacia oleracea]
MNQNDDITTKTNQTKEIVIVDEEEVEKLKQCLPKANWMGSKHFQLLNFQGFWYSTVNFSNILAFQRHFLAQNTDLIVSSFPKTGATWLKSLLFSVTNRFVHPSNKTPLLTHNPHELVYDLETAVYGGNPKLPRPNQLNDLPPPRLLHSHMPYSSLPQSIKISSCKILYICRNPLDTLVSHWHFYPKLIKRVTGDENYQPCNIEDFFEDFCLGKVAFGPFFEHVVGYWKQSLEQPNKVLFLKYEDLKENPSAQLKKMAEFVGIPFSTQEENEGVIKEIIELCSIHKLRDLEVNKSGLLSKFVENKNFFRDGEVGGWTRYLSAPMVEKMKELMEEKLGGSGLSFKLQP